LGDYNLADLSLECQRKTVTLVPQDSHFWSRSILDNFRLADPQASLADIVRVCQQVGADNFISQLPHKYQTVLGEFGANLSGGQRQRLAIARALLRNPPVLILDEVTSGLDQVSEAQVLENLLDYRRGLTTIVISHRPSILEFADWLIVLEKGRLVQQGEVNPLSTHMPNDLSYPLDIPVISSQPRVCQGGSSIPLRREGLPSYLPRGLNVAHAVPLWSQGPFPKPE
jgi:ABC-type bacteriocin/lantibiotic exporter with double-glycine peptidase domain